MASRVQNIKRGAMREAIDHAFQIPTEGPEAAAPTTTSGLAEVLRRDVPAQWVGTAAWTAGLPGEASKESVRAVFEKGEIPASDRPIFRASTQNRMMGAVITAPKTVSALLASPDDAVRDAATNSMRAARDEYVRVLESTLRTRTGAQGVKSERIDGIAAASFEHYSSSSGDPHLHTHLLIANAAPCADGKWRTIDGKTLFAAKRIAEAAASEAMKKSLSESLNLGPDAFEERLVGSVRSFEISALKDCITPLSNAQQHMAQTIEEMGRTLGSQSFGEDMTAWRQHRVSLGSIAEKIEHECDAALCAGGEPAARLRTLWSDRTGGALAAGLHEIDAARLGGSAPSSPRPVGARGAFRTAALGLSPEVERKALSFVENLHTWGHADLAAYLVPDFQNAESASHAAAQLIERWNDAELVAMPDASKIVSVTQAVFRGEDCTTEDLHASTGLHAKLVTGEGLRREQNLLNSATELACADGIALHVEPEEKWSAEQRNAVNVISEGRRLSVITGVAGAGKTTIAAPCAAAARRQGMQVISIARNAARALDTGDGIKADRSMSVAAFLRQDINRLGRNKPVMLVVDEAAVIDRADWSALLEKAGEGRVQIVAFGDRKQAQSIDRKGSFALVEQAARVSGAASVLNKSYRNQAWEDEATAIRNGDKSTLIPMISDRVSKVGEADFAKDIARRVADEPGSIAITMTNAEAAEISRSVQASRGINADFAIAQSSYAGVGDRIRTRKNDHKAGLLNGDRWTVEAVGRDGLTVRNEAGKRVVIEDDYCREFVELDYAATLDSAQGITVSKAIVAVRPGMGQSQLYSAATRGRQAPEYVVISDAQDEAQDVLSAVATRDDLALTAAEIAGENRTRAIVEGAGNEWSGFFARAEAEGVGLDRTQAWVRREVGDEARLEQDIPEYLKPKPTQLPAETQEVKKTEPPQRQHEPEPPEPEPDDPGWTPPSPFSAPRPF